MSTFLGMRGTGDWVSNQRPENWREAILYLYPNGSAPLTAILSMMKKESTDDPVFHWWTKKLPVQGGAVTGIYTDADMTTAYTSGGSAGDTLYVKVAEATAEHFRPGHQAILRDSDDPDVDVNVKVTAVTKNGANSKLTVLLMEDDDNSSSHDLSDADRIFVIGNLNPEGSEAPSALAYDPVEYSNYTQIFRTILEMTRTAQKTRLRTGDAIKEAKREALELHSIEMEKAFLFSIKSLRTGDNGKPERSTWGIRPFVRQYAPNNVANYATDSNYSGNTWIQGGEDWLDNQLEILSRYGKGEVLALCGSGALQGLNKLAKENGNIQLRPRDAAYGLKVREWEHPAITVYLKTHPLMSLEPTTRNSMIFLFPQNLVFRYIDDTKFDPNMETPGTDGTKQGFLTEAGLEIHHPDMFLILDGVGQDNTV